MLSFDVTIYEQLIKHSINSSTYATFSSFFQEVYIYVLFSDKCSSHKCKTYEQCKIQNDKPVCVCPTNCPSTSDPVCASNGKTYSSECHMRVQACNVNTRLTVLRKGKCGELWYRCLEPGFCNRSHFDSLHILASPG